MESASGSMNLMSARDNLFAQIHPEYFGPISQNWMKKESSDQELQECYGGPTEPSERRQYNSLDSGYIELPSFV